MDSEHFVSQEWFKIPERSGTSRFPYVHFGRAGYGEWTIYEPKTQRQLKILSYKSTETI